MSIPTGQYTIVNVRQSNLAYLPDPNDGTPVVANVEQSITKEKVSISIINHLLVVVPTILNPTFLVDRGAQKQ